MERAGIQVKCNDDIRSKRPPIEWWFSKA